MKHKTLYLLLTCCVLLCSCSSSNQNDTYFIHAAGFEESGNEYTVYALCEKLGGKKSDYFVISQTGKSIKDATEQLRKDYKDCYFATAEIYFLPENSDNRLIMHVAKDICDSNTYPSKSSVALADSNLEDFLDRINNEEKLKNIKYNLQNHSTNAVKFFSHYFSGKSVLLPAFSINKFGEISKKKPVRVIADKEVSQNEKQHR